MIGTALKIVVIVEQKESTPSFKARKLLSHGTLSEVSSPIAGTPKGSIHSSGRVPIEPI